MLEPEVERVLDETSAASVSSALHQSLFERLFSDLRAREQIDGVRRVVTLDQQFRMHPRLGQFVSDTFYTPHNESFKSPRDASEFSHAIDAWSRNGVPLPAIWHDIAQGRGKEERKGSSWARVAEAELIARSCKDLLDNSDCALSIGVITFYSAQVKTILDELKRQNIARQDEDGIVEIAEQFRWTESQGRRVERLRVGTVDAFQGMEFDVVFLSVVRSSSTPAQDEAGARRRYGHLKLANRLCVAMSRQRRVLVVVGDACMFEGPVAKEHVPGLHDFLNLCRSDDGLVA